MRLIALIAFSVVIARAPQRINYEVENHWFQLWIDQDRVYHKTCDAQDQCAIKMHDRRRIIDTVHQDVAEQMSELREQESNWQRQQDVNDTLCIELDAQLRNLEAGINGWRLELSGIKSQLEELIKDSQVFVRQLESTDREIQAVDGALVTHPNDTVLLAHKAILLTRRKETYFEIEQLADQGVLMQRRARSLEQNIRQLEKHVISLKEQRAQVTATTVSPLLFEIRERIAAHEGLNSAFAEVIQYLEHLEIEIDATTLSPQQREALQLIHRVLTQQ